jgi:SAM-dependent methyltransferase
MMLGSRETFCYFQCAQCDCLQIAHIPEDMSRYYPANYYSFAGLELPASQTDLRLWFADFVKRRRDIFAVANRGLLGRLFCTIFPSPNLERRSLGIVRPDADSRILDVGCGAGHLLCFLREVGFRNLLGIDPYLAEDIRYANGPEIRRASLDRVEGNWDIIMLHHAFEHVPDPHGILEQIARKLAPGGWCILRIPTVSSHAWERYRTNWYQIDAPRHFFLHSRKSLEMLAERTGLRVEQVLYDSTPWQFRLSELYARDMNEAEAREAGVLDTICSAPVMRAWERETRRLNRQQAGDQAAFFLTHAAGRSARHGRARTAS